MILLYEQEQSVIEMIKANRVHESMGAYQA